MFRTTRWASLLVGTLAAFAWGGSTPARPADPPPREPHVIVAQSTKATAGTGRRPLGQRIAASNLPLRAPSPPDCAQGAYQDACHDAATAANVAAPLAAESTTPVTAQPDAATVPVAAAAPAQVAAVEPAVTPTAPDVPPAFEAEALAAVDMPTDALPDDTSQAEPPLPAVLDDALTHQQPAAPVTLPAEMAAPIVPAQTVRDTLLKRIKVALGTRSRPAAAQAGASSPTPATASPAHPGVEPPTQSRPLATQPNAPVGVAFGQPTLADAADAGSSTDSVAGEDTVVAVPARLEFDVRESRSLVGEGEQIVMRIAVRNVGGETAERVTATLFFAEGIEPVQAIGRSAEVYPGEVRFEAVPQLSPGSSVDLLVTAVGTRPGSVTYRGELECRQLAGRIAREGAVTVRARRLAQP